MNNPATNRVRGSEKSHQHLRVDVGKKKSTLQPVPVQRNGIVKRKPIVKKTSCLKEKKKPKIPPTRNGTKTYQISSTPVATPSKSNSAKNPREKDVELDSLSDISKTSPRSSVCSSVSSGLIELLCNYNSANDKNGDKHEEPERDIGMQDKDETLKNDPTLSIVIPTDEPNFDGRIKVLSELLSKLKATVGSIISSGDTKSLKRLGKIIETMEVEFANLGNDLPALYLRKRDFESEIENVTMPLKNQNAALQRKIRILNQNLADSERQNSQKDINLELETIRCMNNTLMAQVKKLSSLLQELQGEKRRQDDEVMRLKQENQQLNQRLVDKNSEFAKSREIFSTEAGTIKYEVANALEKVDTLKSQLCQAETESELLRVSLDEKDNEISRLNDLNKGLQSSVSRLLEDLRKASTRPQNKLASSESSAFLQNLQNLLNTPQTVSRNPGFGDSLVRKQTSLMKSYPPLSGKENFNHHPLFENLHHPNARTEDVYDEDDLLPPSGYGVLESSRMSSLPTDPPMSVGSELITMQNLEQFSAPEGNKRTLWDQSSVSSFVSFTTRDENDFANGLALLDADIQRLQESLHDMSAKNS